MKTGTETTTGHRPLTWIKIYDAKGNLKRIVQQPLQDNPKELNSAERLKKHTQLRRWRFSNNIIDPFCTIHDRDGGWKRLSDF